MTTKQIRVAIVDDHDLVRAGLRAALSNQADIMLVAESSSPAGLWEALREKRIDVLLLDVKMDGFDVLTALDQLAVMYPAVRTIMVTSLQDPLLVRAAADKKAAGYILKEEAVSEQLPTAIRNVVQGNLWFSPRASQYLIQSSRPRTDLSAYQLDVLRLMVHGKQPQKIADALRRSVSAIYSVQTQIREKLGVTSNVAAVAYAIEHDLVPLLSVDENENSA